MERFDAFGQAVCRQVRHATPRERRAIRAELTGHLEDRAEDLRQRGMPEEEAEERAVAAMGDPEAIGRELNRQYPLGWLIVSRCALVLAAVLVLHLFAPAVATFASVQGNLSTRSNPEMVVQRMKKGSYIGLQSLDLSCQGDGWTLLVCASALRQEEDGTWNAAVATVLYSRNPFSPLPRHLPERICLGEELRGISRSGGKSESVTTYFSQVESGQPSVTLTVPLSADETTFLDIPLDWEEVL